MTSIYSMSSVSFQGKTKKTPRGHEYQQTNKSRNIGAGVGLLSGALISHMSAKKLKTCSGKSRFIESLNYITNGRGLSIFRDANERKKVVKKGVMYTSVGISVLGAIVGSIVGNAIDKNTNKNRAKEADEKAEV